MTTVRTVVFKPEARRRQNPWVRGILLLPAMLLAVALVAGEGAHPPLPLDTLSGGTAPGLLMTYVVLGVGSVAIFVLTVLICYTGLVIGGARAFAGMFKVPLIVTTLLVTLGGFLYVEWTMEDEILDVAKGGLITEEVAMDHWTVAICGKTHSHVCVDWDGHLGHGHVKAPFPGSLQARAAFKEWQQAHDQGKPLYVQWGTTGSGWVASRSARVTSHLLSNAWPDTPAAAATSQR